MIILMAEKNVKKRNWAFVAYPDSLPKDWKEQLQKSGVQCAISPLHDKDLDPTGKPKKPHYHIILVYGSPTTYNNVKSFTNGTLGQSIPQPLEQVRGYHRYLTHEDNPEKAQYEKSEIQYINGFDIRDFVEMTKSEVNKYKCEILDFIADNGICEYADLLLTLRHGGEATADLLEVAMNHTILFSQFIKSLRYKQYEVARTDERVNQCAPDILSYDKKKRMIHWGRKSEKGFYNFE